MKTQNSHEQLRGWFQLIRLPHLFTVPGDPLIGFLIAGGLAKCADGGFFPIAAVCFISFSMSFGKCAANRHTSPIDAYYTISCGLRVGRACIRMPAIGRAR